jgi:hypothetical protein
VCRATAEPKPDNGRVARRLIVVGSASTGAEQIGQIKSAGAEHADFQEIAPRAAIAMGSASIRPKIQHELPREKWEEPQLRAGR